MENASTIIPWHSETLWQEANASFRHTLQRHRDRLDQPCRIAMTIKEQLAPLFPLMDWLCAATCPECHDVCCRHATVWFDFKDLLFLHLAGIPIPEAQLIGHRKDRCRYSSPEGCRLERLQRPFICTWYLCPAQTQCLRQAPHQMADATAYLNRIKELRAELEAAYIQTHL